MDINEKNKWVRKKHPCQNKKNRFPRQKTEPSTLQSQTLYLRAHPDGNNATVIMHSKWVITCHGVIIYFNPEIVVKVVTVPGDVARPKW